MYEYRNVPVRSTVLYVHNLDLQYSICLIPVPGIEYRVQ